MHSHTCTLGLCYSMYPEFCFLFVWVRSTYSNMVLRLRNSRWSGLHVQGLKLVPHRPTSVKPGPKVTPPFSETWEALEKCVEEGLIRSIGVSNFSPEKIEKFILPDAKIRPAVNQVHPTTHTITPINLVSSKVTLYLPGHPVNFAPPSTS